MAKLQGSATALRVSTTLKALSAEVGMPIREGSVTASRDRYYVTVGATKRQIPVGEMIDAKDLRALVGKRVGVIVSGRSVVAIEDVLSRRPPRIICYIPAPELLNRVRPAVRTALLNAYVKEGVIEASVAQRLASVGGIGK